MTSQNNARASDRPSWGAGPVLLVVPDNRPIGQSLIPALELARSWGTALSLVRPVVVPRQTPLDAIDEELAPHRDALEAVEQEARERDSEVDVRTSVRVGHHLDHQIAAAAEDMDAACVLLPGLFPTGPDEVASGNEVEAVLDAVAVPAVAYREPPTPQKIDSVVAAIAGGPHSRGVAILAAGLAGGDRPDLELLHVLDPEPTDEEQETALERMGAAAGEIDGRGDVQLVEASDVVEALLEASHDHDALVIGAPTRNRLRQVLYGSTARELEARAPAWTFTVHADG